MEYNQLIMEPENNFSRKLKAKFMLIKSQKKEVKSPVFSKKFKVFKTTKENPVKKPFKCFQIEKKTHVNHNEYNENIDYYVEYWKIYNDNEKAIEKIKESVYEIYNMKEYINYLENNINVIIQTNCESKYQNGTLENDKNENN